MGPRPYDAARLLFAAHPRLKDAVQPAALEPTGPEIDPARNAKLFAIDDRWRRRLAESPRGLIGPVFLEGSCMPTTFSSGIVVAWIDPTIRPEDGDLVLVRYSDADIARMVEDGAQSPGWLEAYDGQPLGNVYLKQLQHREGHRYLVAEDGALRYGDSQALGVLRFYAEPPIPQAAIDAAMKRALAAAAG